METSNDAAGTLFHREIPVGAYFALNVGEFTKIKGTIQQIDTIRKSLEFS